MSRNIIGSFLLLAAVGLFSSFQSVEQEKEAGKMEWITIEEAFERQASEANPKMIFIDVYTDWCGWCKRMDQTTFAHPTIVKYMQDKFYMVKLDAEQKENIVLKGQTFKFVASGRRGYHELAAALLQGKMSYPSYVFMNEKGEMLTPLAGYQPAKTMYMIASFFGDQEYLETKWDAYQKEFKKPLEEGK